MFDNREIHTTLRMMQVKLSSLWSFVARTYGMSSFCCAASPGEGRVTPVDFQVRAAVPVKYQAYCRLGPADLDGGPGLRPRAEDLVPARSGHAPLHQGALERGV